MRKLYCLEPFKWQKLIDLCNIYLFSASVQAFFTEIVQKKLVKMPFLQT